MEHKSIFEKIKNYKSDPITEYNKIYKYISETYVGGNYSLFDKLSKIFESSSGLSSYYLDLDECIDKNTSKLLFYRAFSFDTIPNPIKEEINEEFLNFCEIILFLTLKLFELVSIGAINSVYNVDALQRCVDIVTVSLKCFNYRFEKDENADGGIKLMKINPEAEAVSKVSPPNIKAAIETYLGIRNSDVEGKKNTIHVLIDLLEPSLKKHENQSTIGKIKMYSQLLRHPELNKDKDEYKWFYKDISAYLDDMFNLCIFVQQYVVTSQIVDKFDNKRKIK